LSKITDTFGQGGTYLAKLETNPAFKGPVASKTPQAKLLFEAIANWNVLGKGSRPEVSFSVNLW
ncbi:hypothetical protein, partial [Zavarzinella formosa]|uniref:hypothetical protein n=1 Tax=Zavarzinella formosa TaxID=360055 RepID=UPI0005943BA4